MQNSKKNWIDGTLLFLVVGIFLFLFGSNVMLLYEQSEIRAAYEIVLDRKPTKEEIALWIQKNADTKEVRDALSLTEERKKIIEKIFEEALGRNISEEESELYKKDALRDIAHQIYRSKERMDVLSQVYTKMLGRSTNRDELFFHIESRSSLVSLRNVLNNSEERRMAIKKTFQELARRNPNNEEMDLALQNATSIVEIRVTLENQ